MSRTSILLMSALLGSLAVAGCGHGDESSPFSFSGSLSSSDAVVGAAISGDRAVLYVCGGPATLATHTRWFEGSVGDFTDGVERDGWTIFASKDESAIGQPMVGLASSPQGDSFPFTLASSFPGSVAGLYSTVDAGCRTGVVVTAGLPGQGPELQGVWCSEAGDIDQVTPGIAPTILDDGGLTVAVDRPEGVRELQVRPFHP